MGAVTRIERALDDAISRAEGGGAPPRLAAAMRAAVFPGGARIRPLLCLAVAGACGDDRPEMADAAAVAIELMHCASLVHDDLPCFDDAPTRRGRPSVQAAFGEPLAVLAGDALIVLAFETLGRAALHAPERLAPLIGIVAASTGMPWGSSRARPGNASPGWSSPPTTGRRPARSSPRRRSRARRPRPARPPPGARSASAWGKPTRSPTTCTTWPPTPAELGKPVGRDAALGRCNAVRTLGIPGAIRRLKGLVAEAVDSIPACAGAPELQALIHAQAKRFVPSSLAHAVAA
jgi:geranylgeranyl diphosphate synthase type II